MPDTIVVAGSVAQKPRQGGHTWQFLQYLLGFRGLGFDVLFLDRLTEEMCHGPLDRSANVGYLADVMARFDLAESWALLHPDGTLGLARAEVLERVRGSLFLLNVMGFLDDEEILGAARSRVFLDTDPGFGQMWRELGLADVFAGHDRHVTIAENIGCDDCAIPTCGIDWITTPQPVVLDEWEPNGVGGDRFTSVGGWRGPYGPIEYGGETYGLRVHEFRKFVELPRRTGQSFELALRIDPAEERDLALLEAGGWSLVDPAAIAFDPDVYRDYIRASRAEFMVARGMYVKARSGWFSERSICYLAAGKPVLAQDTGLEPRYPLGEGLLTFGTLDEAAAGVEEISRDYARHARAARLVAEEHFDSRKVLAQLVEKLA